MASKCQIFTRVHVDSPQSSSPIPNSSKPGTANPERQFFVSAWRVRGRPRPASHFQASGHGDVDAWRDRRGLGVSGVGIYWDLNV